MVPQELIPEEKLQQMKLDRKLEARERLKIGFESCRLFELMKAYGPAGTNPFPLETGRAGVSTMIAQLQEDYRGQMEGIEALTTDD